MKYKKIIFLAIFLVSLLTVSAVSAADNAIGDIVNVEETTDEVVNVENNDVILSENNNVGTFDDLASEINATSEGGLLILTKDYKYVSRSNEGIEINKAITIDGKGHTLDGNQISRIFHVNAEKVTLKDITFINGHTFSYEYEIWSGAVYWSGAEGVLTNCSFVDCSADAYRYEGRGGAVYWSGDNGVLANCSFVNCFAKDDGGAVEWSGDNGTLSGCSFVNSSTNHYGGAVEWSGDNGTLSGCSFVNSSANHYGGAIAWWQYDGILVNCSFVNSSAGYRGGAVYWYGADGVLTNCSFVNSSAQLVDGGAVYWYGADGVLTNCSFVDCYCNGSNGGAVYWSGADGVLANCSFVDCYCNGWNGGAVYWNADNGVLFNCSFINSYAYSGGAVYWNEDNGVLFNCSFINSRAADDGGAVYWNADNGVLANCIFVNSSVGRYSDGGGIYFNGNNCSLIFPCYFEGNSAEYGSDWYSVKPLIIINVTKITTVLTAQDVVTTYNSGKCFTATLKDVNGKAISSAKVTIKLGTTTKTLTTDSNGQVSLTTDGLIPDTYFATISFAGNNIYDKSNTTAKVTINKLDTELTAKYDANSKNIVAVVKDAKGNPVSGVKVGFALDGVKYVITDANGQALYSTKDLAEKVYTVSVMAYGNEIYNDSNKVTVKFGNKQQSKIFLRNALYFVTQVKMVQVTLWDGNNQPLANKTVYIKAYDSVWHGVTDENGDAFVRVGIGFGTHDATVGFEGDDQYNASTRAGYIRVIKQTPSVMVRGGDSMFKANDNNKIVKVHLRDRYDKALPEGSKIVIKLNGKTYVGTTDINGVASIKISIYTVGTFTAQAMYGGNTAYNAVTKDVKIRIV